MAKEKKRIFTPTSDADPGAMKCYTADGALGLCSSSTKESKVQGLLILKAWYKKKVYIVTNFLF